MDVSGVESNSTTGCTHLFNMSMFSHISLIPAALIIMILTTLHKRKAETGCCRCRLALVVPANLLDGYRHRWSYAAAFGATSSRVLLLLLKPDQYWGDDLQAPQWLRQTFLFILAILETSIVFYPLFGCLRSSYKLVAAICGGLYSLMWFTMQMIHMLYCPAIIDTDSFVLIQSNYSRLILQWPSAFFLFVMVVKFSQMLLKSLRSRRFVEQETLSLALDHQVTYVRCLLKNHLPAKLQGAEVEGFFNTFKYMSIPGFRYPLRLLCVLSVTTSISYQIVVGAFFATVQVTEFLVQYAQTLPNNFTAEYRDLIKGGGIVMIVCSWTTLVLLILLLIGSLFLIFKNYRRHILQLCRGDKSFIPPMDLSSPGLVANSMRWAPYQIAYLLWGIFIFYFTVFLIFAIVAEVFYILISTQTSDVVTSFALYIGPPLLMNIIIYYSQEVWSFLLFLQPRCEPGQAVPLAIDNRNVLETTTYFTFFFNIAIGFLSTFFRLLLSLIVGLLTLGRMDQSVLKKGYERLDRGHVAYVGMLFVDYTHNHPVLRVFCRELKGAASDRRPMSTNQDLDTGASNGYGSFDSDHSPTVTEEEERGLRRTAKLWHLAYTLLNNPDLIHLRKHNLDSRQKHFGWQSTSLADSHSVATDRRHEAESENAPGELMDVI